MDKHRAGGQNPQKQPSRAEKLLETGLSEINAAVAELLAHARAVDPERDEYGHARSRAYTDAVALLKASAKLGHTVAELRGTKFEHNINVRRNAAPKPAWDEDDDPQPDWEYRKYQGCDYDPDTRFKEGKVFVHGRGFMHVPDDWNEERWLAGLPQKSEAGIPLPISEDSNGNSGDGDPPPISEGSNGNSGEGDPPSNSGGSNGNFGTAPVGAPRIRSL